MRLSNKSTFSLVCLVLLLAFVALPVMAHQPASGTFDTNHDGKNNDNPNNQAPEETDHVHTGPVKVTKIELVDIKVGSGAAALSTVQGTNVKLVADADATTVALVTSGNNGEFQLKFTFNQDVYSNANGTALVLDDIDDGTDYTIKAALQSATDTDVSNSISIVDFDAATDDTDTTNVDESKRVFTITFQVDSGQVNNILGDSTADPVDPPDPLDVSIALNEDIVFSKTGLVNLQDVQGRNNEKSSAYVFKILNDFLAAPTSLTAVAGDQQVVLTWTAVPGAESYQYSKNGGTDWAAVPGSTGTTTTYTVTALTNGTTYNFQVRAAGGTATASQPATPIPPDTTKPTFTFTTTPADKSALAAGDEVRFHLTASENLGTGNNALVKSDIAETSNIGTLTFVSVPNTMPQQYIVVVVPSEITQPIVLTIPANAVMDTAATPNGNAEQEIKFTPEDKVHPTVVITGAESRETVDGKMATVITFTFDFSEEISTTHKGGFTRDDIDASHSNFGKVLGEGVPVKNATDPTKYTFKVVAAGVGATRIRLKAGSVTDLSNNVLLGDQDGIYTPENVKPAITITGPTLLNQRKFVGNTITIAVRDDLGIKNGLAASEVVITNGVMHPTDFAYANRTATFTIKPNVGAVQVTVTVKADSVFDNLDNGNAKTDETFNVGPILRIPANGHLVVVKDFSKPNTFGFLSDDTRPTQGDINPVRPAILSARTIQVASWLQMPDLERMFDYATGEGGGALVLKKAPTQAAAVEQGALGITEIMWASDLSKIGAPGDEEAQYQWVEIENLTSAAVDVHLFNRVGRETYTIESDEIDRAGNFYDGSLGANRWDINTRGQNGNSYTGVDFISMHRNLPKFDDKSYNYKHVNGMDDGSWVESSLIFLTKTARGVNKEYWHKGTPGRRHISGTDGTTTKAPRTDVKSDSVVFNEIANRTNEKYEWIELHNRSNGEINLKNYLISIVEAKPAQADRDKADNDKIFYQFPSNDKAKIAAGGLFLLVASDPRDNPDHPLAVGNNVDIDDEEQVLGSRDNPRNPDKTVVYYKVMRKDDQQAYQYEGKGLPDSGKFILILRKPDGPQGHRSGAHGGEGVAERGKDDLDKVVDVAGWHNDLKITDYPNSFSPTDLWPLRSFEALDFDRNKFNPETVHRRAHFSSRGSHNDHRAAWQDTGYTGIGYKRQAADSAKHGGTPGHHDDAKGKATDLNVVISEVMLYQGARGNLPQWIELYNTSKTHAVNLADNAGWRLVIENPDRAPIITINFKTKGNVKYIPPNQTVLIVSSSARDYGSDVLPRGTVFPNTRVLNAYTALRGETFALESRNAALVDPKAFNIRLMDGKTTNGKPDGRYAGLIADEIGNLDGIPRTNDTPAANGKEEFPTGMTKDGSRTSLIRIFDDGVARDGMGMVKPLGTKGNGTKQTPVDKTYSWIHAADTDDISRLYVRHTWYGDESDYGSPADRAGQVLPVNLSHFRPTLENGQVVIRWTTESELDNAGFNILRSDTRNGEYKQVNTEMIQGHGTTGERNTYKWVDASAKPGVVYYYQIEDVSFAGERQTLQTTKLKGYISAVGKATTTWGDIKEVQ